MQLKDVTEIICEILKERDKHPPTVEYNKHVRAGLRKALRIIEQAPVVDAVPVVRCKDCVCVSVLNDKLVCERIRISSVMDGSYRGTTGIVKPDDYCSYGIRKRAKKCG